MKQVIDLNCDLGETHPSLSANYDADIMPYISSCNIACGYHAGSKDQIHKTIDLAIKYNVAIGAHPSYNGWENFGRLSVDVPLSILREQIIEQVLLVKSIAESKGQILHHVKPHGALYHDMAQSKELALNILQVIKDVDTNLILYGMSGSHMIAAAKDLNMQYCEEAFADRAYDQPQTLRSRSSDGSVLTQKNKVTEQVKLLLEQRVQLRNGSQVPLSVDTICLHSDIAGASALAKHIHQFISEANVDISHSL